MRSLNYYLCCRPSGEVKQTVVSCLHACMQLLRARSFRNLFNNHYATCCMQCMHCMHCMRFWGFVCMQREAPVQQHNTHERRHPLSYSQAICCFHLLPLLQTLAKSTPEGSSSSSSNSSSNSSSSSYLSRYSPLRAPATAATEAASKATRPHEDASSSSSSSGGSSRRYVYCYSLLACAANTPPAQKGSP